MSVKFDFYSFLRKSRNISIYSNILSLASALVWNIVFLTNFFFNVLKKLSATAPLEGFNEEIKSKIDSTKKLSVSQNANNEWDFVTIVFFVLCLILFAMAIYFSNKNTNKILQQLKENWFSLLVYSLFLYDVSNCWTITIY